MGQKRLLLLRHAKSSWNHPGLADFDRPLNGRGRRAADAVGRFLAAQDLAPDRVVLSSSRRTRETWAAVRRHLDPAPTATGSDALYHGGPSALLQALRGSPESARTVLLLGHNPGLGALAHALAGGEVPGGAGSRFLKFPTAGLAVFAVADRNWAGIGIGDMSIRRFVDARSLPD